MQQKYKDNAPLVANDAATAASASLIAHCSTAKVEMVLSPREAFFAAKDRCGPTEPACVGTAKNDMQTPHDEPSGRRPLYRVTIFHPCTNPDPPLSPPPPPPPSPPSLCRSSSPRPSFPPPPPPCRGLSDWLGPGLTAPRQSSFSFFLRLPRGFLPPVHIQRFLCSVLHDPAYSPHGLCPRQRVPVCIQQYAQGHMLAKYLPAAS